LIIIKFIACLVSGDSGGPLAQNGTLIGVVSFTIHCADPKYPTVFGKVSAVRDWLKEVAGV
jgi:trypsin